jgi:hypothetical protein
MADLPPKTDSHGDAGDDASGTPRWVKVLAIIIVVLLLLFVVMHLTGGGLRNHTPPGDHVLAGGSN